MKRYFIIIILSFICQVIGVAVFAGEQGPTITVGEHHSYNIKWLGVNVGQLDVVVREETVLEGRPVYVIEMTGGTNRFCSRIYRIKDRFVSYVDKERLVSLKLEVSRREGSYKKEAVTVYDYEEGKAYYQNLRSGRRKSYAIPAEVHDIISVFFRMRYDTVTLDQQLIYDVDFAETVYSAFGTPEALGNFEISEGKLIPAFYTKPRAKVGEREVKKGSVSAFFSADDYKIPLQITLKAPLFTQLTMTLTEASSIAV